LTTLRTQCLERWQKVGPRYNLAEFAELQYIFQKYFGFFLIGHTIDVQNKNSHGLLKKGENFANSAICVTLKKVIETIIV
jgi:hypothetical protein